MGRQLSVNYLKALCASRQWLGVNQLWGGGRGSHRVVPSYRKEGCRLGLSLPLETVHQQYSRRQRLERRCVGLVDQSPPKSTRLAGSRPLSTVAVSEGSAKGMNEGWGKRRSQANVLWAARVRRWALGQTRCLWGPKVGPLGTRATSKRLWMYPLDSTILGNARKAELTLIYSCHGSFVDRQHSYRQASCQPDSNRPHNEARPSSRPSKLRCSLAWPRRAKLLRACQRLLCIFPWHRRVPRHGKAAPQLKSLPLVLT